MTPTARGVHIRHGNLPEIYRTPTNSGASCLNASAYLRIEGDYDLFVRLLEVGQVSYHHISAPLAVFDRSGISSNPSYRALRKRENHRVRKTYFPRYRWTLKAWRQEWRNFFIRYGVINSTSGK